MAASCARSLVLASLGIAMVASRPISAITMSSSMRVKPLVFIATRPCEDHIGSTTLILRPARASLQGLDGTIPRWGQGKVKNSQSRWGVATRAHRMKPPSVRIGLYAFQTVVTLAACRNSPAARPEPPPPTSAPSVRVQGNALVDSAGGRVRLRGVNRSGTEYACAQGWGIFDGPSDSASVQAIASWKANVVRVPLNETCWLGINGVASAYAGDNYRRAIADYVALLNRTGLAVILDLHWSAAGTAKALGQAPMPNRDHTPDFWRQVAAAYKGNNSVIFDLFNEPFPDNNSDTPEAWRCWRDGGTCSGMSFQAAGMQELVDAVRSTGATNVILLGGVQYAATLSSWVASKPSDPLNNLAASWHVYNFSWCHTQPCWDSQAAPAAQQVPLVVGELGQDDGGQRFRQFADGLDGRPAGQLPRLGVGRVGTETRLDHELQRNTDPVRSDLQDALRLVAGRASH